VAVAYAVFMLGITYPCFWIPFRLVGLRVSDVWRISARPAIGSVAAGLIAWATVQGLEQVVEPMGALVAGAIAGAVSCLSWYATRAIRREV
jgi:hypothetical protein